MTAMVGMIPRQMIRAMAVPVIAGPPLLVPPRKRASRWLMAGIVVVLCSNEAVDVFSGHREEWCANANEQSQWGLWSDCYRNDWTGMGAQRSSSEGCKVVITCESGWKLKHKGIALADEALCMRVSKEPTLGNVMGHRG